MKSDILSFDALHTDPTPALNQVEKWRGVLRAEP